MFSDVKRARMALDRKLVLSFVGDANTDTFIYPEDSEILFPRHGRCLVKARIQTVV